MTGFESMDKGKRIMAGYPAFIRIVGSAYSVFWFLSFIYRGVGGGKSPQFGKASLSVFVCAKNLFQKSER